MDLTVVSALSIEALAKGAAQRAGVAIEIATRKKRRDYPNIAVLTFVIEDHGRIGEEARTFVRRLAPVEPSARSRALRSLYQALSACCQRASADAVLAAARPPTV